LRDVLSPELDVQRLAIEPAAAANPHRTNAGGRKFISSFTVPAPSHSGQRPCALLKENLAGEYPRNRASGTCAYNCRIVSKNPTYVAGIDRGVRPIGD